jgi:hypothetical protein
MKIMLLAGSILLSVIGLSVGAFGATTLTCNHYATEGVVFITFTMAVKPNSHIERLGELTHYGQTRQTAIEELNPSADQLYNLIVEADHPGQELGLVIYKAALDLESRRAVLINPQMPVMKEMPGTCEYSVN